MNNFITLCARAKLLDMINKREREAFTSYVYLSIDYEGVISLEFFDTVDSLGMIPHYEVLISTTPFVITDLKTFKYLTNRCIDYEYEDACFCILRRDTE